MNNIKIDNVEVLKKLQVPTGHICIIEGYTGKLLELVSLGDYGKEANVKADFMGLDRHIDGVPNGDIMPLSEKWVITISTQYGCSMGCAFCDVPLVGPGHNASIEDMVRQVLAGLQCNPDVRYTKRLNVHYARMGEPTWNTCVLDHAARLKSDVAVWGLDADTVHPVVSTMLPKNNRQLKDFLLCWCANIKNAIYNGEAGLQFSINSTDDKQRLAMFRGNAHTLRAVSELGAELPDPVGRKYALNFALCDDSIIDAEKLIGLFSPEKFMVKVTPMHNTNTSCENGMVTTNGYESYVPYKQVEEQLRNVGFDVLVFVPSKDEDDSLITCGNAILSGKKPSCEFKMLV